MATYRNARRHAAGLTLTELMVTLGIAGVLMGLIVPVIGRVRKAGRDTQCKNNLRRIFEGYKMYMNDAHGKKPMVTNRPSLELNDLPSITDVLEPYTGRQIFRCPLDNMSFYEKDESSYEFNIMVYGRIAEDPLTFGRRVSQNADPANSPAFYDYESFHGRTDSGHSKNAVFGDGHIETF